jgi:hypothetical protein
VSSSPIDPVFLQNCQLISSELLREATPFGVGNTYVVHYVCLCTSDFLARLRSTIENDDAFSEVFIEKTKKRNRLISVLPRNDGGKEPFTRLKADTAYPTLELYLPTPMEPSWAEISTISQTCGNDLEETFVGLSSFDPLKCEQPLPDGGDFLPLVKDLPRPEIALNQGPIYFRIIESLPDGNKSAFDLEGPPDVVELMRDYLCKHAKGGNSTSFYHWLRPHRFGEDVCVLRITDNQCSLSALIITSLLECNLGFDQVGEPFSAGGKIIWLFRREKPFQRR